MVLLTNVLNATKRIRRHLQNSFIDKLRLYVKGGSGGNGFPKYGGVGGQGGDVIIVGSETASLSDITKTVPSKRIVAGHGQHSHPNHILGPPGVTQRIEAPLGITILTDEGKVMGELNAPGDEVLVANGGYGGNPKNGYLGQKGDAYSVVLDLKLIADIGFVGFPNAGKSTLLKALSKAKPKIASYPFTTIRPNIGVIEYRDYRQISLADLPGLIEGAHANIGMGHKFLKHVERTKMLLLVVDINGFQLNPHYPHRTCLDTIVLLNKELELYKPELLDKPAVIVVNKMDVEGARKEYDEIKDKIRHLEDVLDDYSEEIKPERSLVFDDVIPISAKEGGSDIDLVKERLRTLLDVRADMEVQEDVNYKERAHQAMTERGPKLV